MGVGRHGFLEFFAGGGMVRAALGADWECLLANDFSPKKGAAYVANWGADHFRLGDIAELTTADLPGRPDLVWGSSPCQDVSLAGAGAGLAGRRSGMFWAFFDLVRGLRREGRCPKIVTLENVTGLITSHGGADFRAIAAAFAAEGFRFGAMTVDARHWVPQSRPRFFLIAVRPDMILPGGATADGPIEAWHSAALVRAVSELPEDVRERWIWWTLGEPPARAVDLADLIEDDPVDAPWRTRADTDRILEMMAPLHRERIEELRRRTRADGSRAVGCLYKRTRKGIQRAEARFDGVAGCLRTPEGGSSRQTLIVVERGAVRTRLLSSREAARLMGLPDDYVLPARYNEAYHLAGDGVAVPVVRALARRIFEPVLGAAASVAIAAQ